MERKGIYCGIGKEQINDIEETSRRKDNEAVQEDISVDHSKDKKQKRERGK